MEIYQNTNGEDCVIVENEDGTTWSGLKLTWDELEAAKEASGTLS